MKPLLLHYYVTVRCNARCSFCSIWKTPQVADALLPDVEVNLKHARAAGCRFVDFTGGEPLLNANLSEFLRAAKKLGFITSVTTNCLLFPERAKELSGLIDLLHFSIDADSAELHDRIRGKASFNSVIESIDIALANKLIPDLLFTYTNENINSFEGIYRLARKKKLMVILDPVFDCAGDDPLLPATHAAARTYAKRPGVYFNTAHLALREQDGNDCTAPLCRAVNSAIVLLPDNTLALPCFHHKSEVLSIKNNLDELLAGRKRSEAAKKQGSYPFCDRCHINCYFDPSYGYMRNRLFLMSMSSKLRYAWQKHVIYRRPIPRFSGRQ